MLSSLEWCRYFEQNAVSLLEVPWHLGPELTAEEITDLAKSIREFQAGESSEGKHLFHYAQAYADRTGDQAYVSAMRLFIREEQRHARDLGRFLALNQIELVRTTFADWVFRKLRHMLGGLEVSIAVLITAEIIAMVYYDVLRSASQSQILRRLCEQILYDEKRHIQFQSEQLFRLRADRGRVAQTCLMGLQRFLYFGTTWVVWICHRRAIRRGGLTVMTWMTFCWCQFEAAFAVPSSGMEFANVTESDSATANSAEAEA